MYDLKWKIILTKIYLNNLFLPMGKIHLLNWISKTFGKLTLDTRCFEWTLIMSTDQTHIVALTQR